MAEVTITRRWPDTETLSVTVEADSTYPDHLDQARAIAVRTYAEALDVTLATEVPEDEAT
jgi:hypothetical protein